MLSNRNIPRNDTFMKEMHFLFRRNQTTIAALLLWEMVNCSISYCEIGSIRRILSCFRIRKDEKNMNNLGHMNKNMLKCFEDDEQCEGYLYLFMIVFQILFRFMIKFIHIRRPLSHLSCWYSHIFMRSSLCAIKHSHKEFQESLFLKYNQITYWLNPDKTILRVLNTIRVVIESSSTNRFVYRY
jgi:hypothetical protein